MYYFDSCKYMIAIFPGTMDGKGGRAGRAVAVQFYCRDIFSRAPDGTQYAR